MNYWQWKDDIIKRMKVLDIGVLKICVAAFVLMIAKLWSPILSLDWYWYAVVFVVTYVFLLIRLFRK